MFHLAIVLLPLLSFALIATLATGAGLLITALMGGASAALLVKDKCLKRLVLLGCGILALAGIACVGLVLGWSYLVGWCWPSWAGAGAGASAISTAGWAPLCFLPLPPPRRCCSASSWWPSA